VRPLTPRRREELLFQSEGEELSNAVCPGLSFTHFVPKTRL